MSTNATLEPDTTGWGRTISGNTGDGRTARRVRHEVLDGRRVAVKQATGAARVAVRREAAVLSSIASPDVVRHVELREDDDLTELVTLDAGAPSLAALMNDPATSPATSLRVLADACEAVARLHARGWAHGRISQDHILTTPRGRVRLCSLSRAEPTDVGDAAATLDRVALLRTVDLWTEVRPTGLGPLRTIRRRIIERRVRRRTQRLVDDPDPLVLARILRRAAGSKLRTSSTSVRPHRRSTRRRTLVLVVSVAVVGFGSAAVLSGSRLSSDDGSGARPGASPTVATAPSTTNADPAASCAEVEAARPDIDGDGCGDLVSVDHGIVDVNGVRFRVGVPGDQVAVGDWDCDGTATVLAVRPSTGEIYHFPTWADSGAPSTAQLIDLVPGVRDLEPPNASCGRATLTMADGSRATAGATP